MTFRRRPPQQKDHVEEEPRDAEHYDFDDARHFATPSSGQSGFARAGQSHEEHLRDDDSTRRAAAAPTERVEPPPTPKSATSEDEPEKVEHGYYGSGGSYGYGGGFEHAGQAGRQDPYHASRDPGRGNEEFYEATGGFGHDVGGDVPRPHGAAPTGYGRSDERIREDLCEQLDHGELDPSQVLVEVVGGVVKLEGFVDSRYAKLQSEEIAESVMGVRAVQNQLRVRQAGLVEPNREGQHGGSPSASTGRQARKSHISSRPR